MKDVNQVIGVISEEVLKIQESFDQKGTLEVEQICTLVELRQNIKGYLNLVESDAPQLATFKAVRLSIDHLLTRLAQGGENGNLAQQNEQLRAQLSNAESKVKTLRTGLLQLLIQDAQEESKELAGEIELPNTSSANESSALPQEALVVEAEVIADSDDTNFTIKKKPEPVILGNELKDIIGALGNDAESIVPTTDNMRLVFDAIRKGKMMIFNGKHKAQLVPCRSNIEQEFDEMISATELYAHIKKYTQLAESGRKIGITYRNKLIATLCSADIDVKSEAVSTNENSGKSAEELFENYLSEQAASAIKIKAYEFSRHPKAFKKALMNGNKSYQLLTRLGENIYIAPFDANIQEHNVTTTAKHYDFTQSKKAIMEEVNNGERIAITIGGLPYAVLYKYPVPNIDTETVNIDANKEVDDPKIDTEAILTNHIKEAAQNAEPINANQLNRKPSDYLPQLIEEGASYQVNNRYGDQAYLIPYKPEINEEALDDQVNQAKYLSSSGQYLRRAEAGEAIGITKNGELIAILCHPNSNDETGKEGEKKEAGDVDRLSAIAKKAKKITISNIINGGKDILSQLQAGQPLKYERNDGQILLFVPEDQTPEDIQKDDEIGWYGATALRDPEVLNDTYKNGEWCALYKNTSLAGYLTVVPGEGSESES